MAENDTAFVRVSPSAPIVSDVNLPVPLRGLQASAVPGAGAAAAGTVLTTDADNTYSGVRRRVNLAAATQTLTAAQSGQRFVGLVDAVLTLPAAAAATKGVWYELETGAVSAGVGLSISPAAADHIRGAALTAVDNKDLINTAATDALADSARIYCDGVDGWVIENLQGIWAKEA